MRIVEIKLSESFQSEVRRATNSLASSETERTYLEVPHDGFYVSRIKPTDESSIVEIYIEDDGEIFLVCEDIFGRKI